MTEQEYQARALPRLAAIDELDKLCQWDKFMFQIPYEQQEKVRRCREQRERLMSEQSADECAMGY
jgi:hypothetical protein